MEMKMFLVILLLVFTSEAVPAPLRGDIVPPTTFFKLPSKSCGGKPADVVFVLDESSSIWMEHFTKNLKSFVKDIIDIFEISPEFTRVAALTFGNKPRPAFRLIDYDNQKEVIRAVDDIQQIGGNTNTAGALKFMREQMFAAQNGGRKKAIQIGIVITDGKSDDEKETARQASLARKEGIHMFAIGVGKAKMEELESIASSPSDRFVFKVTSYGHLDTIKQMLALETCKVTDAPTTTARPTTTPEPTTTPKPTTTPRPTTTPTTMPTTKVTTKVTTKATTEQMQADRIVACGHRAPADVVFMIPETASPKDTNLALKFIKYIATEYDVTDDAVRVGLVPKQCNNYIEPIALDDYSEKDRLFSGLKDLEFLGPDTASPMHYMRTRSFSECQGSRARSKKIFIAIFDDKSRDVKRTIEEAEKAKKEGVEIFVIAIGKEVDDEELVAVASPLPDQHIYTISTYKELHTAIKTVKKSINMACAEHFYR